MAFWTKSFWNKDQPKVNPDAASAKSVAAPGSAGELWKDLCKLYAKGAVAAAAGAVSSGPSGAAVGFEAAVGSELENKSNKRDWK